MEFVIKVYGDQHDQQILEAEVCQLGFDQDHTLIIPIAVELPASYVEIGYAAMLYGPALALATQLRALDMVVNMTPIHDQQLTSNSGAVTQRVLANPVGSVELYRDRTDTHAPYA